MTRRLRRPGLRAPHRIGALLVALAAVSACSVLPESEPVDIYQLPLPAAANTPSTLPWALRVLRPNAAPTLDSSRIVVQPAGDRVSSYRGKRWSDNAPSLVRDRLTAAFQHDGRLASVSSDDSSVLADLELDSDLRAFQAEYGAGGVPEAVIRLDARLLRPATRRAIATRSFSVRVAAGSPGVDDVVRAFGEAADRLSAELTAWTIAQGEQHPLPARHGRAAPPPRP